MPRHATPLLRVLRSPGPGPGQCRMPFFARAAAASGNRRQYTQCGHWQARRVPASGHPRPAQAQLSRYRDNSGWGTTSTRPPAGVTSES
eukprot:1921835-Rhodomonas_salina.1